MTTKTKRRKFTREFKAEAVKLLLEQGLTRAQASRDLGVTESVLGRWVLLAERDAVPGAATADRSTPATRTRRHSRPSARRRP